MSTHTRTAVQPPPPPAADAVPFDAPPPPSPFVWALAAYARDLAIILAIGAGFVVGQLL